MDHINTRSLELLGSKRVMHINISTEKLKDRCWGGRPCAYNQHTKTSRIYDATTHSVVESRNAVSKYTPSNVMSLSINEPGNIDEMDNGGVASFHDGPKDDAVLRGSRDYTSRTDFTNDATYDHTIPIVLPNDPEVAEILTEIRGII